MAHSQFTSSEFAKFANEWDFEHRTNSPGNSKANGKVESAIKTAKNLNRKALDSRTDPYIAVLDYRNTPTQGMESCPVQCLMNRRTRTLLPTTKALLQPRTPQTDREMIETAKQQAQQSKYYNQHTRDLPTLTEGDGTRMKLCQLGTKMWKKGIVTSRLDERSYVVETPDEETYRRNRYHLKKTKERPDAPTTPDVTAVSYTGYSSSPTKSTREVPHIETSNTPDATSELLTAASRPPAYLTDYVTTQTIPWTVCR